MRVAGLDILVAEDVDAQLARRHTWHRNLLGAAAAAGGSLLWRRHPVLGALTGFAIATNGYRTIVEGHGHEAFSNLASTATGVGGSLLIKSHPAVGFAAGYAVGAVATSRFLDRRAV